MQQKNIQLGNVNVPVIEDDNEIWFPVSYVTTKILLRSGKNSLISKNNKDKYKQHLRNYVIDFGEKNMQESKCINRTGLIELFEHTHVGRLSDVQRKGQNELHKYLGLELLPVGEIDVKKYKNEWFQEVDDYTREIIKNELKNNNVKWVRMCSKCYKHFPLTNRFFITDNRADKGLTKICKICSGVDQFFTHQDTDKAHYKRTQVELLKAINDDQNMLIYYALKEGKIKRLPDCYRNKESYRRIIKELHRQNVINENNLIYDYLVKGCKLIGVSNFLSITEIYSL